MDCILRIALYLRRIALTTFPIPAEEKHLYSMMLPPPYFRVMCSVSEFSFALIWPEHFLAHVYCVSPMTCRNDWLFMALFQQWFSSLPQRPDLWISPAWAVDLCKIHNPRSIIQVGESVHRQLFVVNSRNLAFMKDWQQKSHCWKKSNKSSPYSLPAMW